MRVIAGKSKGKRLVAPKSMHTRPTTDKVKEAIFSMIGYIDEEDKALDLFSGTGGMGIEFLSRNAKEVVFIDNNAESIRCIRENVSGCKLDSQSRIYKQEVAKAIKILHLNHEKFSFIFLDPPYEKALVKEVLDLLKEMPILTDEGIIIAEHEKQLVIEDDECFEVTKRKEYGDIAVSFLAYREE